jgi:Uma2 family endonuclease
MSAANQLPAGMTVSEFLAWDPPDHGDRWELIDGIPHAMAPAAPRHGFIQAEAARLIGNHLAETRPACRAIIEPGIQPKVRADVNVRVPDLAVTCAPWDDPQEQTVREPLVLIEILSPSNQAATWQNVWSYTTIPSVREILVLHTTDVRADLLRRAVDGTWPDNPRVLAAGDAVTMEAIGFSAPLVAFYRTAG